MPWADGPADNSEYSILAYFSLMKEQKEVGINILLSPGAHDQIHFFLLKI